MSDSTKLAHLEKLREDVRDEIKRRIQQRDQYSMQLTVALGAVAIAACSPKGNARVLIIAPLISLYFTALILYSYGIHDLLATYLRCEIEPEFKGLCNLPTEIEWENWYRGTRRRVGVRRWFFKAEMSTVTLLSLVYLWHNEGGIAGLQAWLQAPQWNTFRTALGLATVVYLSAILWITVLPRKLAARERNRDWPVGKVKPHWRRAVFLDRDGTINLDTHFPHRVEELEFLPGAKEGLKALAGLPLDIIVVANQAGIALGFFTRDQMSRFNAELRSQIEAAGARVDAFYFCPHLEPKHLKAGDTPCNCSKPAPGMLLEAGRDFDIDLRRSFFIGDKSSDVAAGQAAGCVTILVETGKAGREEGALPVHPMYTAANLSEAARIVKNYLDRESAVGTEFASATAEADPLKPQS